MTSRRLFLRAASGLLLGGGVVRAQNPFVAEDAPSNPFVAEDVSAAPKKKRRNGEIDFYTRASCPPCSRWERDVRPAVEKVGWKVNKIQTTTLPTPTFHIWDSGVRYDHVGFMSIQDMWKLLPRRTKEEIEETLKPGHLTPPSTARARWSWSGDLASHLRGWPHFMDTSGWTLGQMKYAHDYHHDIIGPVRNGRLSRPWKPSIWSERSTAVNTYCPTGMRSA